MFFSLPLLQIEKENIELDMVEEGFFFLTLRKSKVKEPKLKNLRATWKDWGRLYTI